MEFGLSEEQTLLQDSVNRFLSDQCSLDTVRKIAAGDDSDKTIWQGLTELGIPGLIIPEALGGIGLGAVDAVIVAETLGYHVTPSPFTSSSLIAATALLAADAETQLLADVAAGKTRIGIAFSEYVGARDTAGITATNDKLTGSCLFVLDTDANYFLVATNDGELYLVNGTDLPRTNLTTVDKTRTTCKLVFDQTPATKLSSSKDVIQKALNMGRIALAADTLGAGQNMLDQAVAYAKQREQFDRPIATFQAVKHMCAEMAASLEPCRSMVWYAGHAFDSVPAEASLLACHGKAHLSEVGKFVAKTATEVHGGMGFTDLVGLHYWFKRIGFNRQLLGSPELLREEAASLQGLVAA